ncbi:hypothetical protein AKO1_006678 [Acrasis kona]|uniref:Esterase/lipase HI n=1 Tax=Acrasis kona TaxID=1008807 RepID=A0AAW2YKK5_9EUKA
MSTSVDIPLQDHTNGKFDAIETPKSVKRVVNWPIVLAVVLIISILVFIIAFITVFFAIYGGIGVYGFNTIYAANPSVEGQGCYNLNRAANNPSNYRPSYCGSVNSSIPRYFLPQSNWSYVTFQSRTIKDEGAVDPSMRIKAILMLSNPDKDPFVIAVHGIRSCKESVIDNIAMLWKNGFNVLALDLRNHGESEVSSKYPYASFGNQEHWDVLGGLDYLLANYPRLSNSSKNIGIFGESMGGSTATVTFAVDGGVNLNAAWLDAPAIYIRDTLYANIVMYGFDPNYVLSSVCSRSKIAWPYGCPPFRYDPETLLSTIKPGRHVYFVSKTNDKIVPINNSYRASEKLIKQGVNVTTWFDIDLNQPSYCGSHCDMIGFKPDQYEQRMVSFFNDHLVRLP